MSDAASMVFARWRVLTGARWSKLDGACKITRLILPYNPDQKKLQDHPNARNSLGNSMRNSDFPEIEPIGIPFPIAFPNIAKSGLTP